MRESPLTASAEHADAAAGRCVLSLAGLPREALLVAVRTRTAAGTVSVAHP